MTAFIKNSIKEDLAYLQKAKEYLDSAETMYCEHFKNEIIIDQKYADILTEIKNAQEALTKQTENFKNLRNTNESHS